MRTAWYRSVTATALIGKTYAQKINPDESPVVVARRLTKKFYFARRGGKDDFNRPLSYPPLPKWM
jgi:hypothetical protein